MEIIDLSKPIRFNRDDPIFMQVKVRKKAHWRARWLVRFLGLPFKLMPKDFVGWADDTITKMGVHSTTHIDAPWHYGPESDDGKGGKVPAKTVDQIPLNECFGPGIVIDMSHKPDGESITAADIEKDLAASGAVITEGSIVLIRTDRDKYLGTKKYWKKGTGMTADATELLLDRGSTVMGIDQWGWDLPFHYQITLSKTNKVDNLFWEGHRIGQKRPYWQMEQLVNLSKLPSHGFKVGVFPLRLEGASAAPARVVAFLGDSNIL